jgi:hypothetical protein
VSKPNWIIGYGKGEIEPKIAPLVDAVQKAALVTFSSCEGHIDDPAETDTLARFTSVAFYAHEAQARHIHEFFLRYRGRLVCSWCLRGGFVLHRKTNQFVLGWTLENCGIIEQGEPTDFVADTVKGGWNTDIPLLVAMFADIRGRRQAG